MVRAIAATTFEDVSIARDDVAEREAYYLKRFGWKYTSDTPGSYWLWQKTLDDGRVVLTDADTAVDMTRRVWDQPED